MIKITFKKNGNPMYWKFETMIGKTVVSPLCETILVENMHAINSEWGYVKNDHEKSIVSKIEYETEKAIAVRVGVCGGVDNLEAKANLLLWIPKSKIDCVENYSMGQIMEDVKLRRTPLDYYFKVVK